MKKNRRRYPRVLSGKGLGGKIKGIEARWPDGSKTPVLDISSVGLAVVSHQNPSWEISKGNRFTLDLVFAGDKEFPFECEVVRSDSDSTAFIFLELQDESAKHLHAFFTPEALSQNTHLVKPDHHIKEQGFDYWYHGPNHTNVFIWGDPWRIKRCTVEFNRQVLNIESGLFFKSESKDYVPVPTEDYAHQINNPDHHVQLPKEDNFVVQVFDFLKNIPDKQGMINQLLESVSER